MVCNKVKYAEPSFWRWRGKDVCVASCLIFDQTFWAVVFFKLIYNEAKPLMKSHYELISYLIISLMLFYQEVDHFCKFKIWLRRKVVKYFNRRWTIPTLIMPGIKSWLFERIINKISRKLFVKVWKDEKLPPSTNKEQLT